MKPIKIFLALLPIIAVLDLAWIGWLMRDVYSRELGALARRSGDSLAPNMPAAALVYLLIPAGLVMFVLPRIETSSLAMSAAWGAAFGLVMYGVYEFTNYAVIDGWSMKMVVYDLGWGCTLCAVSSLAMKWLSNVFGP